MTGTPERAAAITALLRAVVAMLINQDQVPALTTRSLSYQHASACDTGRMELKELHVL